MKNLFIIFVLTLFTATGKSQSLTEKDIMGTWQVVNVDNSGADPSPERRMDIAYLDFYEDGSLVLRARQNDSGRPIYKTISPQGAKWNFEADTQTIRILENNFNLKVEGNADNAVFTIKESGLKLQVTKPI